ncbi:MAG: sortase [Candidatus Dormibacteraeota bacterium]|nr:sortase [Candidatus Dormibacteraeota bacterium]
MTADDNRPEIEWRFGPGSKRAPAWLRWTRRLVVLAGLSGAVIGIVFAIQFMQTPALLLDQAPSPIDSYAAVHVASGPAPTTPRTGVWIEVPTLAIALPIRPGDGSNNIPDWVALRYPGTAEAGNSGNSYLYAHGLRGMFGTLLFAKPQEAVILHNYTTGMLRTLHISRVVGRVKWDDGSWITQFSPVPMLTLQTCVGADIHSDRWIVQAT